MKFYKVLALGMVASMAFTACDSDNDDYTFADKPEGAQVYFPTQNPASYRLSMADEPLTFNVAISRGSSDAATTVGLINQAPKGVSVPQEVSFAAGQSSTDVVITYDPRVIGYDNQFSVTLQVADESLTTPYGYSSYSFNAIIPSPWTSLGECTYIEQFVGIWFGVDNISYAVEIQENDLQPGYYRLVYPYDGKYGYNDTGDWDSTKDYFLEIHAENPEKVYIDKQQIGINWGYGMFSVWSLASYYMAKDDLASAEPYYGTLQDGIISFPSGALLCSLAEYNNGGFSQGGAGGPMVVLPGYVLADYSATLSYNGKLYDADDNLYIVANAELGADVEEVRLAVCPADDASAMAQGIIDEAYPDFVSLTASGTANLPMDAASESGKYAIVAVTYAGGVAQEAASVNFKYTSLNGEPAEMWTANFVGTYTYSKVAEGDDEGLILYSSDDDETRCKIGDWGEGTDLIFTWDAEDVITLAADQDMEFSQGNYGNFFISDMGAACPLTSSGATWAQIIKANWPDNLSGSEDKTGYYESNILYYNTVYYSDAGYVFGWGYETFKLTGNASAPRRGTQGLAPATYAAPVRDSHIKMLDKPVQLKEFVRTPKACAKSF